MCQGCRDKSAGPLPSRLSPECRGPAPGHAPGWWGARTRAGVWGPCSACWSPSVHRVGLSFPETSCPAVSGAEGRRAWSTGPGPGHVSSRLNGRLMPLPRGGLPGSTRGTPAPWHPVPDIEIGGFRKRTMVSISGGGAGGRCGRVSSYNHSELVLIKPFLKSHKGKCQVNSALSSVESSFM